MGKREERAVRTTLLASALIALSIGAIVMIAILRLTNDAQGLPWSNDWNNEIALAAGLCASWITALLYSRRSRESSCPDRVNPWQYGELSSRRDYLAASFEEFCSEIKRTEKIDQTKASQADCREANVHIQVIGEELGLISDRPTSSTDQPDIGHIRRPRTDSPDRWILGTGFVELWRRVHAAEAALYSQRPVPQILEYAHHDSLRLGGCGMENWSVLKGRVDLAISALDAIYKRGVTDADAAKINLETQTLIGIRRILDAYRDQSRAGLARTRVHLVWAGTMTAVVAYALLALAVLDDVPPYQIVAGAAFFLVGAVAGLIWQLRNSGNTIRSGEDDFGLDAARLIYVPVLSGLAGVGGVLVMAMLYPTLNVLPDTTGAGEVGRTIPQMGDIFDLNKNRFGLLVAAVFGLTPDLLINRLQGEEERYRRQLESTSVQTGSNELAVTDDRLIAQVVAAVEAKREGTTAAPEASEAA